MKHKKIKLSVLLLFIGISANAQQATAASGGDASGSGGNVAFTVGQVDYSSFEDASGSVSQGVQKAFEIYTLGIKNTELNILLSVFPNPTSDMLTLDVSNYNSEPLSYQLYDMQNRLIHEEGISSNQTQIDLNDLSAATYFINIFQNDSQIQSFKIIKN